jgi:hypothetical protein
MPSMKFIDNLSKLRRMGKKQEKVRLDPRGLLKIFKVFGRHYKKYWKTLAMAHLALFATIGVTMLAP